MRRRIVWRLCGGAALLAGALGAPAAPAQGSAPGALYASWIRADPQRPRILFIGLSRFRDGIVIDRVIRSLDGGSTFSNGFAYSCDGFPNDPFVVAPAGHAVYADCGNGTARSLDEGGTWAPVGPDGVQAAQVSSSPLSGTRLYAAVHEWQSPDQGDGCSGYLEVSDDAGTTWRTAHPPSNGSETDVGRPVADTRHPDTVYVPLVDCGGGATFLGHIARSRDAGRHWDVVQAPAGLRNFTLGTDPHEPGLLVGTSTGTGVAADRRYLSRDQGTTWQIGRCPGNLHGFCPIDVVDNVFGAGVSYALTYSGIYAFHGGGPARTRLAVNAHLPLALGAIRDMAGGERAGDPVYLLGPDTLYRSVDAGNTWRALPLPVPRDVPPTQAQPSTAAGALYVHATGHSVDPRFVATYRRLGLRVIGLPVAEAYRDGDILYQTFEHLELGWDGSQVRVTGLGSEVLEDRLHQGDTALAPYADDGTDAAPVAKTPTTLYFPSTRHTISGDFLRFWQHHGGMGVLGAPISEVVRDTNGDGSGRVYAMQYFTNARLERHPELRDPRYAILLGLLGDEAVVARGWRYP